MKSAGRPMEEIRKLASSIVVWERGLADVNSEGTDNGLEIYA